MNRVLNESELTRFSFLVASLCASPHIWARLMMIVTNKPEPDRPEFEDAVNALWEALSSSSNMTQVAEKLARSEGACREVGLIVQQQLDLNYTGNVSLL